MAEHVVPEASLVVVLQLWEVEVRGRTPVEGLSGVMEEDEAEVHEAGRRWLTVDLDVTLGEVPTPWPDDQRGGLVVDGVTLAVALEGEVTANGVAHVDLTVEHVVPGRGAGVLEVGHEYPGTGVQGVDHHLAFRRSGDLDASVEQVLGWGRHCPCA